jgi:predicted RNA-binding Zn ribbon-like protein
MKGVFVMGPTQAIEELNILSERLCLDFVNTVSWHLSNEPYDWLKNYRDLVVWSQRVNILPKEKAEDLIKLAEAFPERAANVFAETLQLREAVFRILQSRLTNAPNIQQDLDILNQHLKRTHQFLYLEMGNGHFNYSFEDTLEMDCMVWEIVQSTARFLTSNELAKLKFCDGGKCGWMFIDTTRNHSRRWCSMEDCGNRAKAKRHYRKKRKGE